MKHYDVSGNEIEVGDTITTTKGDQYGKPKTGIIYGFDMWSVFHRARINNTSHGKPTSTILVKNAVLVKKGKQDD